MLPPNRAGDQAGRKREKRQALSSSSIPFAKEKDDDEKGITLFFPFRRA
jgi:hypothetical protein